MRSYWPLYKSGVIDECSKSLDLFDPDHVDEDGAAEIFMNLMLLLIVSA